MNLIFYIIVILFCLSLFVSFVGHCIRCAHQEAPVLDLDALSAESVEVVAFFLNTLTYPWGFLPSLPWHNPHSERQADPILLLPGYALNRFSMLPLAIYLRLRGYPWVWTVNHPVHLDDIPTFAKHLDEKIRWYKWRTQSERITVITHSMGGIVSALALQHHQSDIGTLITMATPWRGSRMSVFGVGKQVKQLSPQSDVIQKVRPPTVDHLALWSQQDWILLPTKNAIKEGLESREIRHIGHFSFLIHHRVFSTIHQYLQQKYDSKSSIHHG
ncbi:MAG: hypothetical protein VX278_18710 [Myxococcota bacterium]|nr:hypothetical protein [Myxococcota bacterium]